VGREIGRGRGRGDGSRRLVEGGKKPAVSTRISYLRVTDTAHRLGRFSILQQYEYVLLFRDQEPPSKNKRNPERTYQSIVALSSEDEEDLDPLLVP
jgi:hypothetical protein